MKKSVTRRYHPSIIMSQMSILLKKKRGDKDAELQLKQARQEIGESYEWTDIGKAATIDGLLEELDFNERLYGLIDRCLKRLLMVRGVKSLSLAPSSVSTPQISTSRKAG